MKRRRFIQALSSLLFVPAPFGLSDPLDRIRRIEDGIEVVDNYADVMFELCQRATSRHPFSIEVWTKKAEISWLKFMCSRKLEDQVFYLRELLVSGDRHFRLGDAEAADDAYEDVFTYGFEEPALDALEQERDISLQRSRAMKKVQIEKHIENGQRVVRFRRIR